MTTRHSVSLSDRIVRYLKSNPTQFVCGGELQKLAANVGYEPQNAGRRLRELAAEGTLEVQYKKGQRGQEVAWYRYKAPAPTQLTFM